MSMRWTVNLSLEQEFCWMIKILYFYDTFRMFH